MANRSQQEETLLQAIAISSLGGQVVSQQDRHTAFQVLTDFKKFDGRIPICLAWLEQERILRHVAPQPQQPTVDNDITVSTKLFALDVLQDFLKTRYSQLEPSDRMALRQAVLTAARQLAPTPSKVVEARILGNKLAALLAGLVVRDFPQRWTTLLEDIFNPTSIAPYGSNYHLNGGLWNVVHGSTDLDNSTNSLSSTAGDDRDGSTMGIKMCLECLKLVAEDCTDSDFNAKVRWSNLSCLLNLNAVCSFCCFSDLLLPLLPN